MKEQANFTSGPWHWDSGDDFVFEILDSRNGIITGVVYDISINQSTAKMQANACLIAAAPELLEACEYLLLTEDNTDCSEDLTVVASDAIEKIKYYKRVLVMDSSYAVAHNNIGVAYYYADDIDSSYIDSSFLHLHKAVELDKNYR